MKKVFGFGVVALAAALVLSGCTSSPTPDPEPGPVEEAIPASLIPYAPKVSQQQFETFASDLSFPGDAPAYAALGPNNAILFLAGYTDDACPMILESVEVDGKIARVTLGHEENVEDCGPFQIVKPYGFSLGAVHFDAIETVEFCYQDECKPAKLLKTPDLEDQVEVITPEEAEPAEDQ